MASTGDAPPPPPQPEELTTSALLSLITSPNSADHLAALTIIRNEPSIYIEITPYLNGLFTRTILNSDDAPLLSMARETFIVLASEVGRRGDATATNNLFSPLARTLIATVQDLPTDRADGNSILLLLTNLASALPQALIPHLAATISLCHEIIDNSDSEEESRTKASDLLVTLCEMAPESIPVNSMSAIVDSFLVMMSKVSELYDGSSIQVSPEATLGKQCLARVVTSLHERSIVEVCLQQAAKFLQYEDWQSREAAVIQLEVIGTTGRIVMIEQIVQCISFAIKDPDARVRKSACDALLEMVPSFVPSSTYLNDITPALISAMGETSSPRLANTACKTIHSIIGCCPQSVLSSIDVLVSAILRNFVEVAPMRDIEDSPHDELTQSQLSIVESLALASIQVGSSAESLMKKLGIDLNRSSFRISTEQFESIYDRLIESLKWLLPNQHLLLPAMRCISRVSISVGKAKFIRDAPFVLHACAFRLDFLNSTECQSLVSNLRGIFESLGEDCVPFLPLLMPPLIRIARCPPFHVGSTRESCSTSTMNFFYDLANNLKEKLAPWVMDIAKAAADNLKTSIPTMRFYLLFSCVEKEGVTAKRSLWVPYWQAVKEAINCEDNKRHFHCYACTVSNCVGELVPEGVSRDEVNEIGLMIKILLEKRLKGDNRKLITFVGDDEIHKMTAGEYLIEMISVLIQNLFLSTCANVFNVVHELMPLILSTIETSCHSLRIVREYLRNAPKLNFVYSQPISSLLLSSLTDERHELRYDAALGIGYIAITQSVEWVPFLSHSIPLLPTAIDRPDARSTDECIRATEVAISAAAMIIKHYARIDGVDLISSFVNWLTRHCIYKDTDEAAQVYDVLADLIQAGHPLIIGNNNENWPKLLKIILKTISFNVFDDSTEGKRVRGRLEAIVKNIKVTEENFNSIVEEAKLDDGEKKILASLIC